VVVPFVLLVLLALLRLLRVILSILLLPVLSQIPIVFVFVLVLEPLRVVLELPTVVSNVIPLMLNLIRPTRSLPDMPEFFPAAACASFAFRIASSSASFLFNLVCFHLANDSDVTGVRFVPSLCRSVSRNVSSEITFAFSASARAFL
jgi:hypothetical protein